MLFDGTSLQQVRNESVKVLLDMLLEDERVKQQFHDKMGIVIQSFIFPYMEQIEQTTFEAVAEGSKSTQQWLSTWLTGEFMWIDGSLQFLFLLFSFASSFLLALFSFSPRFPPPPFPLPRFPHPVHVYLLIFLPTFLSDITFAVFDGACKLIQLLFALRLEHQGTLPDDVEETWKTFISRLVFAFECRSELIIRSAVCSISIMVKGMSKTFLR